MPDLELIVVDDASSDKTPAIMERLKQPRVRYLRSEKNLGGGGARNRGIEKARGKYIAFLDDDDEWASNKLRMQLQYAEDYAMVGTRYRVIRSREIPVATKGLRWIKNAIGTHETTKISLLDILESNCGISPSSALFRTEELKSIGGYDECLAANQGRDLFIRCIKRHGAAVRVNKQLVVQHQEHDYGRISESGGARLSSLDTVHNRYRHLMPPWLRKFDRARIALLKAMVADDPEHKSSLQREALAQFHPRMTLAFARLYASYFIRQS